MNSQEPNKYVRLKRARITKAVALTRKSVCPRATGLYLAQIQSRVKINEKIIHGETRSHFISFSSSKGPHTQKKLSAWLSLFSLSLSLSLSPPFVQIFLLSMTDGGRALAFFFYNHDHHHEKKSKKKRKKERHLLLLLLLLLLLQI